MFMPPSSHEDDEFRGAGLTNLEYALLAEEMGHISWASEVFNCSAPDTGNMEVLMRYGSKEHKKKWLRPLMDGEIRSAFLMTEPAVASSDATNIETSIKRDGDHYVINGRKWWSSGVGDPRCKIAIVMGKTDPSRGAPPAAVADPGAARRPRHQGREDAAGVRLRRCAARPRPGAARERPRSRQQHPARRGQGFRDRAGPSRSRPHPSLHAHHRQGRGGAGEDGAGGCRRAPPSARRSSSTRSGNSASPRPAPTSR